MLELDRSLKSILAILAVVLAVGILLVHPKIDDGEGVVIATLAAGAGYLFKDIESETRSLRNICQAHAAVIETQFQELMASLSDAELARFLELAPSIAGGSENEAISVRPDDRFALLPDMKQSLHILGEDTVSFISKWRVKTADLMGIYDLLGTRQLSSLSTDRLERYINTTIKIVRDEYRDIGFTALLCLQRDAPRIRVRLSSHQKSGARDLRGGGTSIDPSGPWLGVRR